MPITIEKLASEPSGFPHLCELGLDDVLCGDSHVAWVRGLLQGCFGPPTSAGDEYKTTFEYVLRVKVADGVVDLGISDYKGNLDCRTYGEVAPELVEVALRELRRRLLHTPAADYNADFLWDENTPYGCHHGGPYVHERGEILVEVKPRETGANAAATAAPSEAELKVFFAQTAPPGSPPFATMREYILAAYLAAHHAPATGEPDDALAARAAALRLPVVRWAEFAIDHIAVALQQTMLSRMYVDNLLRWEPPAPMLAWTRAILELLDAWFERGVKKRMVKGKQIPLESAAYVWRAVRAELAELAEFLVDVEREDRRCRLRVPTLGPDLDD